MPHVTQAVQETISHCSLSTQETRIQINIMKELIRQFLIALNNKFPKGDEPYSEGFMLVPGRKYTKVCRERTGTPCSAYAFIDNTTGDLFLPAGFNAPAKHARGNIQNDTGLDACGPYGVTYRR